MSTLPQSNMMLKTYYKQIRSLFPIYGKQERRFLKALQNSISDFMNDNPDSSYEEIIDVFGSPEDVIRDYFADINMDELYKKISVSKYIKRGIAICIAVIILVCAIRVGVLYQLYLEGKEAIIVKEVTKIE